MLELTGKDFFIIVNMFVLISAIIAGLFKFRDKLSQKVTSGQLNMNQVRVFWIELAMIISVSLYFYTVGLYNLIYNINEEVLKSNQQIVNLLLVFFGFVKTAVFISLFLTITCFILIKILRTKK